jgi:Ring finger domain
MRRECKMMEEWCRDDRAKRRLEGCSWTVPMGVIGYLSKSTLVVPVDITLITALFIFRQEISALPYETITGEELTAQQGGVHATCAICLEDFTEGEEVKKLPCGGGHRFHPLCIGQWLREHATCPNCMEYLRRGDSGKGTIHDLD